jgi:hypothetical protein
VHECNGGDTALDQEDVLEIGAWEDFSGSGGALPRSLMTRGVNVWDGDLASIEREADPTVGDRGRRTDMFRTRQRLIFIDFKTGQKEG